METTSFSKQRQERKASVRKKIEKIRKRKEYTQHSRKVPINKEEDRQNGDTILRQLEREKEREREQNSCSKSVISFLCMGGWKKLNDIELQKKTSIIFLVQKNNR